MPFMCCTSTGNRSFPLLCFYYSGSTEVETEEAPDEGFLTLLPVFWVVMAQGHALFVPQFMMLTNISKLKS